MDIPKFKDVTQKLSAFKIYSSLLVPVGVVVVSVLVFIPTQLMSIKLKAQINKESIAIGKRVNSLSRNAVASDQWKNEQIYQQAYESDANQIASLARQSTQRQLLSYKIFPEPKDTSTLIFDEFGWQFRKAAEELITRINACDRPTDAELERNLTKDSGLSSWGISRRGSTSTSREVDATIKDALCRAKAESASTYANPIDLSGYKFWEKYEYTGMEKAVKDCWYWQLAYWIIEDVIDTIGTCNSGSKSVFTSPVKRLIAVSFTTDTTSFKERPTENDNPSYIRSIQDVLTEPCTARLSNNETDIVHFNVVVIINTKDVLPFMQQLCGAKQHKFRGFDGNDPQQTFKHNQITILESDIGQIDKEDEAHSLYRYGDDAVVRLDLVCEYIFNKKGYDEIKPDSIKKEKS